MSDGMILLLWWLGTGAAILLTCVAIHCVETIINRIRSGWYSKGNGNKI